MKKFFWEKALTLYKYFPFRSVYTISLQWHFSGCIHVHWKYSCGEVVSNTQLHQQFRLALKYTVQENAGFLVLTPIYTGKVGEKAQDLISAWQLVIYQA